MIAKFKAWLKAEVLAHWPQIIITALVVAAVAFVCIWWHNRPAPVAVGKTVVATAAPEVKNVPKVNAVMAQPPKVYAKPKQVKTALGLPKKIIQDTSEQVIASNKVASDDDHPHTVTTVINEQTGESQTFVRTDPLPWIAFDYSGRAGMYAGIKDGAPTVRLQAQQELFSVKAVHFGAIASVDQPISPTTANGTSYFVGVGAEYRW